MAEHKDIYAKQPENYHLMVMAEDYQKNLPKALQEIVPLFNKDILDMGAGTGRVTQIAAPLARNLAATDLSPAMLRYARKEMGSLGYYNIDWVLADHRRLPFRQRSFDLILSGWSLCYLYSWDHKNWKRNLDIAFAGMRRVLKRSGIVILIETFGTGATEPVFVPELEPYYQYLYALGFGVTWVRTDYAFKDEKTAAGLVEPFFGKEMLKKLLVSKQQTILPECTGIWHRGF